MNELRFPDGRLLHQGQEVTVDGLRGRFRWLGRICQGDGSLELFGGPAGREMFRCVMPGRVKTIHRVAKTRKGQE